MSNVLNLVAPSFISVSYLTQAIEMKNVLEGFGAKFTLPDNFEENEDTFLELLPQLLAQFPLYLAQSKVQELEIEAAFFSLISMIQLLSQVEQIEKTSKDLSNALIADSSPNRAALKSKLLGHQFNCYEAQLPSTFFLLSNVLQLVKETGTLRYVSLDIPQVVGWLETWECDVQDQRSLFRRLYEALNALNQGEKAIQALVHLLRLYSENEGVEAKSDAHLCIISHIAHPKIFVMDHLLDLHPIRALEGHLIHDMLQIFVTGDLNNYIEFYNSNKDFVEKLAVTHEENLRKMRLLTIASVAEGCSEIAFSEVMQKVQLEKDEVEDFIIQAIGSSLIKGKINEPEEKVLINSSINRTFGDPQWAMIKNRLELWQRNLQSIQQIMSKGHYAIPAAGAGG